MSGVARCPDCGGGLVAARRLERNRIEPVETRLCLQCGHETPARYDRTRVERNGRTRYLRPAACLRCGRVTRREGRERYCGPLCGARAPRSSHWSATRQPARRSA